MDRVPDFGHSGPKGTFELYLPQKKKSLFEILNDGLKNFCNFYDVIIPWYIMTSYTNDFVTKSFFEENKFFGYPSNSIKFFVQNRLPIIDIDGKVLLSEPYLIKQASNRKSVMCILH